MSTASRLAKLAEGLDSNGVLSALLATNSIPQNNPRPRISPTLG